ncbi:helix-turn-helix domain-containing protein [Candidatus Uhrbacteria bacterium]|nr:helix-turn-helix domain-containing protein [Candidatus Uhrbacteria bacterium]
MTTAHLIDALRVFGFDAKHAQVYLACVELGSTTVLELARRTRLPRTTLYPILESLRREGYVRLGKRRRGSVYAAEPPASLAARLQSRTHAFTEVLPELEALRSSVRPGAGVTLYEGSDGFRQLWERIFRSGVSSYEICTSGVGLTEFVREAYLVERIIAERIRRGIRSRQLIVDSPTARRIVAKDAEELRESRLLPSGTTFPATTITFGEEVGFITTRRENTMILIASGEIAVTLRATFELLWSGAAPAARRASAQ